LVCSHFYIQFWPFDDAILELDAIHGTLCKGNLFFNPVLGCSYIVACDLFIGHSNHAAASRQSHRTYYLYHLFWKIIFFIAFFSVVMESRYTWCRCYWPVKESSVNLTVRCSVFFFHLFLNIKLLSFSLSVRINYNHSFWSTLFFNFLSVFSLVLSMRAWCRLSCVENMIQRTKNIKENKKYLLKAIMIVCTLCLQLIFINLFLDKTIHPILLHTVSREYHENNVTLLKNECECQYYMYFWSSNTADLFQTLNLQS